MILFLLIWGVMGSLFFRDLPPGTSLSIGEQLIVYLVGLLRVLETAPLGPGMAVDSWYRQVTAPCVVVERRFVCFLIFYTSVGLPFGTAP